MRRTVNLGVEVKNDRDIVVSHPEFGFSVTYRKDGDAPMLFAIEGIDRSDDPPKVKFWRRRGRPHIRKLAQSAGLTPNLSTSTKFR